MFETEWKMFCGMFMGDVSYLDVCVVDVNDMNDVEDVGNDGCTNV